MKETPPTPKPPPNMGWASPKEGPPINLLNERYMESEVGLLRKDLAKIIQLDGRSL